ncbi:MAG: His/Gly/Thr/Pro-type tRNA ligase C-terminal domain-containing protein, partial [Candidatus Hodarchaeota archaeon]
VLLRFVPPDKGYYWVINVEFCIVDSLDRPVEIATVQIDVGNAKRFNIRYLDPESQEDYPVILHTALIGSIERYFDAVLENASVQAKRSRSKIALPFWLSPVQIRLIPIQEEHNSFCFDLLKRLEKQQLRGDIDNRMKSLSRRVRDAERELIPLIIVVGDEELKTGLFQVRSRLKEENRKMNEKELEILVRDKQGKYPFRPFTLPKWVQKQPAFF